MLKERRKIKRILFLSFLMVFLLIANESQAANSVYATPQIKRHRRSPKKKQTVQKPKSDKKDTGDKIAKKETEKHVKENEEDKPTEPTVSLDNTKAKEIIKPNQDKNIDTRFNSLVHYQKLAETEDLYPIQHLNDYNILIQLPKIGMPFQLVHSPFISFVYGPYEPSKEVYIHPYPSTQELTQRIKALRKTIKQNSISENLDPLDEKNNTEEIEKQKKLLAEMKIHLADLHVMKYSKTHSPNRLQEATQFYKTTYQDLPLSFFQTTSLNMANVLIENKEFTTVFPFIKMLTKKTSIKHSKKINNTTMEFYFMSSRYQKADDIINVLIENKQLLNESKNFLLRTGDVLFALNRFQDASEWYQTILKPKEKSTQAEKVSWLYLAESLHQVGKEEISKKVYNAMLPFFKDTIHENVIKYRLSSSLGYKENLLASTQNLTISKWIKIELLTEKFIKDPKQFTSDSFDELLAEIPFDHKLKNQIILLQGYAYRNEDKNYKAIDNFHILEMRTRNRFVRAAINNMIIKTLFTQGMLTENTEEALKFIRYIIALKYNLKEHTPDKVYNLLYHNLDLIGLENASAELTLKIIDQSIHNVKDKLYIQFKLAENMHDAFAFRQSIKILNQIDTKLLDPASKEKYYTLLVDNLMETHQKASALEVLNQWEKMGTTPKLSYWITLRKVELLYNYERYTDAIEVIENTLGFQDFSNLPQEYTKLIIPTRAYQVLLYNKLGRNNECLVTFYRFKNTVLKTSIRDEVILAAISSAMAMNKTKDIKILMRIAKVNLNQSAYSWLDKWTSGEMWINQVNKYLDRSNLAIKGGK